jgi:parallel beta-helix repeat protein
MPGMPSPDDSDLDVGATHRSFAPGQTLFDRYTLIRILGRGGMGVVWLAQDEKLERDVALKFLPELVVYDPAVLEELKRETKRSLALTHHGIVRIHDFVQGGESACISMEYVDGPTLSALRVQRPKKVFEPEELAPWMKQLGEALGYAHERAQVVHRDLKPANIMLNSRGEVKITDFGIARSVSDSMSMLSAAHRASGTLVYMSPQQLDGERTSPLDDIYSLGATLYELLTGKPPFYSGNIDRQIREKIAPLIGFRRQELSVQSDALIPQEWDRVIAACLAKNPTARPQSAKEVSYRLGLTADYKPPQIKGKAASPTTLSRRAINKRLALIAAVVLLAGCGASAAWWFGAEHPRRLAEQARLSEQRAADERAIEKQRLADQARADEEARLAEEKRKAEQAKAEESKRRLAEKQRLEEEAKQKEIARLAEEKRKADEAEALVRQAAEVEAKRRAEAAAEVERKAEERRKAEEARIAKLPKTITVPGDEVTISAAMMRAKKGDTIKVQPGTYEDQIAFKDGVILAGDSRKSVTVQCQPNRVALTVQDCTSGHVSGITFKHVSTAAEPTSSWIISIANSHVEISDCFIQNGGGFGILIANRASPVIHDCIIQQNTLSGIIVNDDGTKPRLKSNQFRENGESGAYFRLGSSGVLEKNQFEANGNGVSIANEKTNVTLRFNQLSRNRYNGIWFSAGAAGVAEDNKCEGNRAGIVVEGSGTKPTLVSNHCRGNTDVGILLSNGSAGSVEKSECDGSPKGIVVTGVGTSPSLTGNHCFANHRINGLNGFGITFEQGATGSVLGNTCENNEASGIWVGNGASPALQGNICRTNGGNGLEFRFASTGMVTTNTCERNVGNGITVTDQGTSPVITDNRIVGNGSNGIYVGVGATPTIGQNSISGHRYAPIYYENVPRTEGDY